ncbi:transcriptional regulator [Sphaerisporangium melleum]|uniref:Transcriptional regulator n=1 Tax=Sphaerisporangium melleum TaxID=321316 RepID=A0A917RD25_9ACTN|nr:helix-turn-helix transcriptional regulator [Sphaerisporangium melleum]GGL02477.1 transcriptional regulator [Sphaerisporangium melleum]GII72250.1 transcriptional regulator [Sphaerisporangium melleum]
MSGPRMTMQTQALLRMALSEPSREWYGLQMCEATGLPSGTIYPIIARLERAGWLESRWERPEEHAAEGRPRRRYYRLTGQGAERARLALASAYRSRSTARLPFGAGPTPGDLT